MIRVIGIDLSLNGTGVACDCGIHVVDPGKRRDAARLVYVEALVGHHVVGDCAPPEALPLPPSVVVLEGYAFGRPNQAHQLGELGGVIRHQLWCYARPFVVIPPAKLKQFATGKGNADKTAMVVAARERFGYEGTNNNEADAYLLRCMGLLAYDAVWPFKVLAHMREIVGMIQWPELAA